MFGLSSVLGPVVGGFLAGQNTILGIDGWRWVFLVNVPIGLVSLLLVMRTLHLPHTRRDHKIDYLGALTLVVALVPLLIVAEQGREWGWTSMWSLGAYATGAIGVIGFLWAENRIGEDALLPLRLFRGRTFGVGSILNFVVGMGMFGGLAALPLYVQIVKGYSPTEAGLLLGRARAIEDQLVLVQCNTGGTHGGLPMGGHSQVVDATGRVLAEAGADEEVLVVDLDLAAVDAWRADFPVLADRRL